MGCLILKSSSKSSLQISLLAPIHSNDKALGSIP